MSQHWTLWSDIVRGHHIAIRQRPASTQEGPEAEAKFFEIDGKEVTMQAGQSLLADAGRFDVIERYAVGSRENEEAGGAA